MVGQEPKNAVSKLAYLVLSSAISCRSSIFQVVSSPFGWSPLSSFLVAWSPSGDTRGPSVAFEAVGVLYPGPFHFSHIANYIYDFCPLPDPDVGLSIIVCDVEHTSFDVGLCGRKFVLCLFNQCPCLCTLICHTCHHTGVVHLSLQADGSQMPNIYRIRDWHVHGMV